MDKLWDLSDEEYKRICDVIPHQLIVGYFKHNPKDYDKLCRIRIRATALSEDRAHSLLANNRKSDFVFSFVKRTVERWLCEIKDAIDNFIAEGKTEMQAMIYALSQSYFANNLSAFFILVDKELTEETKQSVTEAVAIIRDIREQASRDIEDLKREIATISRNAELQAKELDRREKRITEYSKEVTELKKLCTKCKQLEKTIESLTVERDSLRINCNSLSTQNNEFQQRNEALQGEINILKKQLQEIEQKVRDQLQEEQQRVAIEEVLPYALIPSDINDFTEYFGYNISACGVDSNEFKNLLIQFLEDTAFLGRPIVCQMRYSATLAKCLANTIIGTQDFPVLTYSKDIDSVAIANAIASAKRIVLLQNFLGNYDETQLIAITQRFPSKIIIIDCMYNQTIRFLPKELFEYCIYLDLSKFPSFGNATKIEEDPSTIDEIRNSISTRCNSLCFRKVQDIVNELGMKQFAISSVPIEKEESAIALLLLSVLPYWQIANQADARNKSKSLQTYIARSRSRIFFNKWYES